MLSMPSPSRLPLLLPILLSLSHLVVSSPPSCDCYLISGPNPGYFTHHFFWDFRSIPSNPNNDDDYTDAPPFITPGEDDGTEPVTSTYFNTSSFGTQWSIQTWSQPSTYLTPIESVNSARNIYISRNASDPANPTYLTLRANRLEHFMSIAEVDSLRTDILHSSYRAKLRVIPSNLANSPADDPYSTNSDNDDTVAPGAVIGFFTYNSSFSEADIEILTRDPQNRIRYTNQPDYNEATDTTYPGASTDAVLPSSLEWTEWITHRLDWMPLATRFWADEELVLNKAVNVPRIPSGLVLNLWGDGNTWSGNMTVGDSVAIGVEWIEVVFNVSGEDTGSSCGVGCTIDGVQEVGVPEVVFNRPTSSAAGMSLVRDMKVIGNICFGVIVIFGCYLLSV